MAIKLIHHVNVQISDRDRTRAWYEKVLGAEFLDRGPALNRRQLQLRLGEPGESACRTPHSPTRWSDCGVVSVITRRARRAGKDHGNDTFSCPSD